MASTPILIDYAMSPFSQKVHQLCAATGTPLKSWDQPIVLPRAALEDLGITYRRIPILAIGKDIFCDSSLIIDTLQEHYEHLDACPADKAYEEFGASTFRLALRIIPKEAWNPDLVKDRETIFHDILRPDLATLRPSALAEFRASLDIIEQDFLGGSKSWINGDKQTLADIHVGFSVGWILNFVGIGSEPGFGREDFPKVYAWLDKFPTRERDILPQDEAIKLITESEYLVTPSRILSSDPQKDLLGERVSVESFDTTPGAHPQLGVLIDLTINKIVIKLPNSLRIHFPRRGYIVRKHNVTFSGDCVLSQATQSKSSSAIQDIIQHNALSSSLTLDISLSPEDHTTLSESQSNHIPFSMSSIPTKLFLAMGALIIFVTITIIITVVVILFN